MAVDSRRGPVETFTALPERKQQWIVRLIALVVIVLVWEVIGRSIGNLFLAPLSDVIPAYIDFALGNEATGIDAVMFPLLVNALWEMFIGFALAVVIAIPVGLMMGRNRVLEELFNPWVSAMFVTSTASLLPLFIILFGIRLKFRLAIVFVSCVWFIMLNTYHGAKGVDRNYIDVGTTFNANRVKQFRDIILPGTLPYMFAGLRMGLIHALRGIILAETFISTGYGGLIHDFGVQTADTKYVLALILTIMVFGYVLRISLEKTQDVLFPWSEDTTIEA